MPLLTSNPTPPDQRLTALGLENQSTSRPKRRRITNLRPPDRAKKREKHSNNQVSNFQPPTSNIQPMPGYSTNQQIVEAARRNLSQSAWDYLVGASDSETTMRRNRLAFDRVA